MTKNVMISQKMSGESMEDMLRVRAEIVSHIDPSIELNIINPISYPEGEVPEGAGRLWFLGRAIQRLDNCDLVIFADNYGKANGCRVEHAAVILYGISYVYALELEPNMSWDKLMSLAQSHTYSNLGEIVTF